MSEVTFTEKNLRGRGSGMLYNGLRACLDTEKHRVISIYNAMNRAVTFHPR